MVSANVGLVKKNLLIKPIYYSPDGLVRSSLAMISGWNSLPLLGQSHHCPGVENAESEEMVELQTDSVHGPVEATFSVEQRVPLGG